MQRSCSPKLILCKPQRRYKALCVPSPLALFQDIISLPHWSPIPTLTRLYNGAPSSRGRPKLIRVTVHSIFSLGVMPRNAITDSFHAVTPVPRNSGISPAFVLAVKVNMKGVRSSCKKVPFLFSDPHDGKQSFTIYRNVQSLTKCLSMLHDAG